MLLDHHGQDVAELELVGQSAGWESLFCGFFAVWSRRVCPLAQSRGSPFPSDINPNVQLVCSLPSRVPALRFPERTGTSILALQVTSYSALQTWMVIVLGSEENGGREPLAEAMYFPSGDQASVSVGEAFLVKV